MKNTLFKYLFGLVAGICMAEIHPVAHYWYYFIAVCITGISLCCFIRSIQFFFLPLIILAGFLLHSFQIYPPNVVMRVTNPALEVVSPVEHKKNNHRVLVKVNYISPLLSLEDYAWIYFDKTDSILNKLAPGNKIYTRLPLKKINQYLPAYQFDYVRYQQRKRIFYTAYLPPAAYRIDPNSDWFKNHILSIHQYLASSIEGAIENKHHAAIALSLILGDRNSIDQEMIETYSKIGIIHLLSVSGLHVGIFILLIQFVFKKLKRPRPLLRLMTIIFFLIVYSLITGGSLPVIRCAIMFSIIEFGKYIQRNSHILHSLAASAFILLLYHTQFLFDIGFQLSYLALVGILLLHKKIYQKIYFENKLLDKIWEMCCSTLAAWLFTTPLVVYYFHNLSLIGNLANIAAIPIAALILYAGMLVLLCSFSLPIMKLLGHGIDLLIATLNQIVECFYHLPGAFIGDIYISSAITYTIYAMVYCLLQFLFTKKSTYLAALLIVASLTSMIFIEEKYTLQQTNFMRISGNRKAPVLLLKQHKQLLYFGRDTSGDTEKTLQAIRNYYAIQNVKKGKSAAFIINQQTMLVLDQVNLIMDTTDYLVCLTTNKYKIHRQLEQTVVRKGILARLYKEKDIHTIQEMLMQKKFEGVIQLDYANPTLPL